MVFFLGRVVIFLVSRIVARKMIYGYDLLDSVSEIGLTLILLKKLTSPLNCYFKNIILLKKWHAIDILFFSISL